MGFYLGKGGLSISTEVDFLYFQAFMVSGIGSLIAAFFRRL